MKVFSTLAAVIAGAHAAFTQDEMPEGALKLDIKRELHTIDKRQAPDLGHPLLTRANQEFTDNIQNNKFYYSTSVKIGTPPQSVTLLVDTGSADTWVFTRQTRFQGTGTRPNSFFDPSQSSSFKSNGTSYTIQYGIGTSTGKWGTDNFGIGNVNVKSLSIGIADTGDVSQGILGIGRAEAEITNKRGVIYENLPMKLVSQGIINTAAYSMYLNHLSSKSGSILFGAVDHSKYTGKLQALKINHPKHLGVTLTQMRGDGRDKNGLMSKPQVAILDSGTSLSYVPFDVVDRMGDAFNTNPSFALGQKYYCDCNVTSSMILEFGSISIKVPNYFFLWPIETVVNPVVANFAFPQNSCYIGIEPAQQGMNFVLLGDNFLRAFYAVYDLTNGHIAIAQAKYTNEQPKIEVIKNRIPGATYG
jgi:yapsin 1